MAKVTVLGTGAMGSRMAKNLISAGNTVKVWNRDRTKLASLIAAGAIPADTPGLAVQDADFVISMVRDDEASQQVWLNEVDGALAAMPAEAVGIESSTLTVGWVKELSNAFVRKGISFVDAPVAGSRPQAEAARLIYFVGGEMQVVEAVKPLLLVMGGAVHHAGPVGSGAAIKLVVNALYGIQVAALAELFDLIRREGLNEEGATAILASTPAMSPAAKIAAEAMVKRSFAPLFPIELVAKDFSYAALTADKSEVDLPMVKAGLKVFERAVAEGLGQDNISGVAQLYT
jgi:3-hydroxyisobutyrate dehydrogenase-like beta-hydroxyacid dehydrogenase